MAFPLGIAVRVGESAIGVSLLPPGDRGEPWGRPVSVAGHRVTAIGVRVCLA